MEMWSIWESGTAPVSYTHLLGLIGGANAPGEVVRQEIRKARELTKKPIGVNIMLMSPYADEVAKVVVEEGVRVVTTCLLYTSKATWINSVRILFPATQPW